MVNLRLYDQCISYEANLKFLGTTLKFLKNVYKKKHQQDSNVKSLGKLVKSMFVPTWRNEQKIKNIKSSPNRCFKSSYEDKI